MGDNLSDLARIVNSESKHNVRVLKWGLTEEKPQRYPVLKSKGRSAKRMTEEDFKLEIEIAINMIMCLTNVIFEEVKPLEKGHVLFSIGSNLIPAGVKKPENTRIGFTNMNTKGQNETDIFPVNEPRVGEFELDKGMDRLK